MQHNEQLAHKVLFKVEKAAVFAATNPKGWQTLAILGKPQLNLTQTASGIINRLT